MCIIMYIRQKPDHDFLFNHFSSIAKYIFWVSPITAITAHMDIVPENYNEESIHKSMDKYFKRTLIGIHNDNIRPMYWLEAK
jgi:hypothetical protein